MRLDDYTEKDGKRVWLTVDEIDKLAEEVVTPEQKVAVMLGGRAGLRRSEIVSVTPNDIEHGPDGFVRIWSDYSKRDKYREAPIPDRLKYMIEPMVHEKDSDEPVVDVSGTTVYRWVQKYASVLEEKTGDEGWQYLDVHDLRRSWGGHLLWDCGVLPTVVMEFGGWTDWDTFAEHYMGEITPRAQERERSKIFGEEEPEDGEVFRPGTQAIGETYGRG